MRATPRGGRATLARPDLLRLQCVLRAVAGVGQQPGRGVRCAHGPNGGQHLPFRIAAGNEGGTRDGLDETATTTLKASITGKVKLLGYEKQELITAEAPGRWYRNGTETVTSNIRNGTGAGKPTVRQLHDAPRRKPESTTDGRAGITTDAAR